MIDNVTLNFNQSSVLILNVVLAFIMFGIALDLKIERFQEVIKTPKSLMVGMLAQFILLPFFTYILILIFNPIPSMALGMILVASCPGGNISNFISAVAKANVELSIVLTSISSICAIFMVPFNFSFYGEMYGPTSEILKTVNLDWLEVGQTIALIIVLPIFAGKLLSHYKPLWTNKLKSPIRNTSMLLFLFIVVGALLSNGQYFLKYIQDVFGLVFIHNAIALSIAFLLAIIFKLKIKDKKSITIETGIQNSGLGLLLIFSFFQGLGGMAIIAAWWGVWHIVSGFTLAYFWKNKD